LIFEKTLMTLAAAAAIAAAAGVAVVAAAFALYTLLAPALGAAGAAATVAACAAVAVLLAGLIVASKAKDRNRDAQQAFSAAGSGDMGGLIAKVMELAKQRPLIAAGAALAAGLFALRNPILLAAIVKAIFDTPGTPPPRR
jgi:hypothetical protein